MALPLEEFWADMLSRNRAKIAGAWHSLTPEEKAAVKQHLERMCVEEGWIPPQRESAQTALQTIHKLE